MSFFKFNTEEWLTGKYQLLSPDEKGIFVDIVARLWMNNGVLQNDEYLYRLLRVKKGTLLQALQTLFDMKILQENNGFLSAEFVTEQIAKKQDFTLKMKESGAKGGRPKKGKKGYPFVGFTDPFDKEEKENKEKEKVSPTPPLKEKENKEKEENISLTKKKLLNAQVREETQDAKYPASAVEILEIAKSPFCGMKCSEEQARRYYLLRASKDWIDGMRRKVLPHNIALDLKLWLLKEAEKDQNKNGIEVREEGF